jgi:hypothetical protein
MSTFSPCGINCHECEAYIATQNNDLEILKNTSKTSKNNSARKYPLPNSIAMAAWLMDARSAFVPSVPSASAVRQRLCELCFLPRFPLLQWFIHLDSGFCVQSKSAVDPQTLIYHIPE